MTEKGHSEMLTNKINYERILVALFLLTVFILSIIKIEDTDTWTHLSFGRWIWEHKAIPLNDPFILTGRPLPYNNWLFGFLYYMAYLSLNIYGVVLLKAITVTIAFYILVKDSLLPHRNFSVAIIVMTIIVAIARYRFVERPDTFLMIFLPFIVYSLNAFLFNNKKYVYAVPVIGMLWANSHTSLPLIFIPFLSFIIGGLLQHYFNSRGMRFQNTPSMSQIKVILLILVISFLASLISPYFLSQYFYGSQVITSDWWKQEILELQAPSGLIIDVLYGLTGIIILSFIINIRYISLIHLFLVIPFIVLSFSSNRFFFLIGIIAGPILSRNFSSFIETRSLSDFFRRKIVAGLVVVWTISYVPLTLAKINPLDELKTFGFGINYSILPEGALKYMDKKGITGKVFNLFQWGGYITWRDFPRRQAFVDGRGFLDGELLEKIQLARKREDILDELNSIYGFESILIDYPVILKEDVFDPATDSALSHPGWALVYWDDNCLLYLKRGGKYASIIKEDEYGIVKPANGLYGIRRWLRDENSRSAIIAEIGRNIRETGSSRGYAFLGFIYSEIGLYREAIAAFSKVRATPLVSYEQEAYSGIGYAYNKLGNPDESVKYYKKALAIGNNATILSEIGRVFLDKGDKENALKYFNLALKKNKYLASVYPLLMNLYGELGRPDDVTRTKSLYKEALSINEGEEHFKEGVKAYIGRRFDIAFDEFKKSIIANPANPSSYSNIGYLCLDIGNLNMAYEYQSKALDIDPNFANAHYGLALIDKRWGDLKDEKKHLEEYLRLEPAGYYSRKAKAEIEIVQGSNNSP